MSFYECTLIARQDISSSDVEKLVDELKDVLKDKGGDLVKREYWGLRGLAYRVKKNRKGHYAHLGINAPSVAMDELNRRMHLNEDVIRTLTVKVDALSEEPSAVLQSASSGGRDERPGNRPGRPPRRDTRDSRDTRHTETKE